MRANRRQNRKLSVAAHRTCYLAGVVLTLFIVVIVNLVAESNCAQAMKAIGEKERLLASLEADRVRESARWEEMKTPERIESALLRNGLSMNYARPDQRIRMRDDGTPYPGQSSITAAKAVASFKEPTRSVGRGSRRVRR